MAYIQKRLTFKYTSLPLWSIFECDLHWRAAYNHESTVAKAISLLMLILIVYVSVLLSNTSLQLKMSIYCNSFCSHLTAKKACIKAQKWFKLRYKALLTIWQCDESKGVFALTSLFLFFVLPSPCLVFCVITNVSIFFLLDALACYFFFLRLKQKAKKWRHEIVLPQQWWWSKQLFLH